MPEDTPQQGKTDRHGPILFGLMAFGVLVPHGYPLLLDLATGPEMPPILFLRLLVWGGIVYLLYLGFLGARWLILASVALGAFTFGWEAVSVLRLGYTVTAAPFAALALAPPPRLSAAMPGRSPSEIALPRRYKSAAVSNTAVLKTCPRPESSWAVKPATYVTITEPSVAGNQNERRTSWPDQLSPACSCLRK